MIGRVCSKCVIGVEDDPFIVFDEDGVCNHCKTYDIVLHRYKNFLINRDEELKRLIHKIKRSKKGKYDCVIGVSGGTDSSYLAYLVKQWGLNPLAVHFDNGWNSELSVRNLEKVTKTLNIDLYTFVVNWQEFRDIQKAYIEASVVDVEFPTDNGIFGAMYLVAKKYGVKYVLPGSSTFTEGFLPSSWNHNKIDMMNMADILKKNGNVKMVTFPSLSHFDLFLYDKIFRIKSINLLDYIDYNKKEAQLLIQKELNWENYGGKHNESIFTKFYQAYILPTKFNIDKRKSHFSTLICAGQLTREEAFGLLETPIYTAEELKADKKFVLKKLGYTEVEFDDIMQRPRVEHTAYRSIMHFYYFGSKVKQKIRKLLFVKSNK